MAEARSTMELVLDRSAASTRHARRALQQFLGDDASIGLVRKALLLTGELVANAIEHTGSGCGLSASFDRRLQHLRIELDDSSTHIATTAELPDGQGNPNETRCGSSWSMRQPESVAVLVG